MKLGGLPYVLSAPLVKAGSRTKGACACTRADQSCLGRVGKLLATRAPTRSGSNLSVRLRRSRRPLGRSCRGLARRLRTRSIARSKYEDYRDVFEKRAPLRSSPPPSAPKNKEALQRRLCFWSSPTQVPTAEAPENKEGGTPTDYVFRGPRPPARHQSSAVLSGKDGWRHLGRAAKQSRRRPDGGGLGLVLQGLLSFVRVAQTVQALYQCLYPFFYRTRVPIPRIATRVR
jgi:hypothetical protein